ncbi:MAG: RNA-guided endonuclease TnpB family protein [Elainellaceae cyanobacterium]
MKLRYRYRIYPNTVQVRSLARLFGCSRVVWNDALAFCQSGWAAGVKYPGSSELMKRFITQAKHTTEREWLGEVSNIPLQQSIRDLDVAFRNFWNSAKGKRKGLKVKAPRFKKRSANQSARFTVNSFSIKGEKVYLAKIGKLKTVWSRPLPSAPSSATVIKDASGRYFLSFVCDADVTELPVSPNSVGVDLGISTFAALSTGEKIDAPKPLKTALKRLKRLQQSLSRKVKGSKRRELARLKGAQLHARVADTRSDFLHKLSTRLIRENQSISLEDLNVPGMVKNRKLSRAISDLGWRQFRTMLEAKAAMHGREVNIINRWEPTSQTCSCCGKRGGKLDLKIRLWECLFCGATHDRDINAAINIEVAGGQLETKNGRGEKRKPKPSLAALGEASTHLLGEQLCLNF